jgi:hypothetical protein
MDDSDVEIDATDMLEELSGYEDVLKNLPMEVYGMLLVSKVDEMFQSQGAAGTDGAWDPLMASTLKRHPRRRGGMILQDTGATAAGVYAEQVGHTMQLMASTHQSRYLLGGTENMVKRDFFALNFAAVLEELGEMVVQEFH